MRGREIISERNSGQEARKFRLVRNTSSTLLGLAPVRGGGRTKDGNTAPTTLEVSSVRTSVFGVNGASAVGLHLENWRGKKVRHNCGRHID